MIVGGGPAGSVAALCLRKLGHEVVLFERLRFPRYRIGESLLPGTLSILSRLGVADRIEAAGFVKKRAATFIWGGNRPPWSFTFSTPKTTPWVFDHAYQVTRADYDRILLDAARERGAVIREACEVTDVGFAASDDAAIVTYRGAQGLETIDSDWVVDASGARGVIAQKVSQRKWDRYYRNMAVWSYFRGGRRLGGDLEGNILSVTFKEGWIWIIPLQNDVYSVGVVTGVESNARMRDVGPDTFYHECLKSCPLAADILASARQCDEVRILRDWSYEADTFSWRRGFLCGDAACFVDPLFSQGVHLATYSAMLAAAAIDHLCVNPGDAAEVHEWYRHAYREAYQRYHRFVAAFYAYNEEPDSTFWSNRKIAGSRDQRFQGKEWFASMTGHDPEVETQGLEELEQGAATLADLWRHSTHALSDQYDGTELSLRRLRWANQLLKELQGLAALRWRTQTVRLTPSFRVHPTTFKLERQLFVGDETGRVMTTYAVNEQHRTVLESLITRPLSYRELTERLRGLGGQGTPLQIVTRLIEDGLLQGYDPTGRPRTIHASLRFGGVGADDDLS